MSDPLWRRLADVGYVLTVTVADLVALAIEDGARRAWARLR